MKMELTQTIVLRQLSIERRPALENGSVVYVDNPSRTPFLVFDTHREAPIGFGVKVGATKKTYVIQRRVGAHVVKAKIGDVADYPSIALARTAAAEMARAMVASGRNPNAVRRERVASLASHTLGAALAAYREHLATRGNKRATPATLRVVDAAIRHFADWSERPLSRLTSEEIKTRFAAGIQRAGTSSATDRGRSVTEQRFRWASAAVRHALRREEHEAHAEGREPRLRVNPFSVLNFERLLRSKADLERDYKVRLARNPLGVRDGTLGRFLDAIWARRPRSRIGSDYLLLTLLLGARKNETAALQWFDRLSYAEAARTSYVDLHRRLIRFHGTKNRSDHELPIADGALEILKQRYDERATGELYVFPVRSSKKTTKAVHYSDPKSILSYLRTDAGLPLLRPHDLRRTFGRVAEETTSDRMVKRLLNHLDPRNATSGYTDPEWPRVVEVLQKVECAILAAAPMVYNALLPSSTYPRMTLRDDDARNAPQPG